MLALPMLMLKVTGNQDFALITDVSFTEGDSLRDTFRRIIDKDSEWRSRLVNSNLFVSIIYLLFPACFTSY